jgi:DNA-binding IclR family transcriptional regulator
MIQDPNDPAHFSYYEERLTTYYSPFDVRLSLSILDILSPEKRPMTFTSLANLIRYKIETAEDEQIRQVLKVLVKDHYLYRDSEGAYDFRYTLIKRWWSYSRGQQ